MATEWYIQLGGETVGPMTSADLLKRVRAGEVQPTTQIRKDDSQWVAAEEVNGLMDAATRDRVFKCPYCGERISRPPCSCPNCTRWLEFTTDFVDPSDAKQKANNKRTPGVVRRVTNWVRDLLTDDE